MLSRFMRLSLLCLVLISLASPGFAARRSSLGGNLFIKDADEIFFLPQRVVDYNRMVNFDFGTSNTSGSGGIVFGGERMVFGAFTHRSNFLGSIPDAFFTVGDFENIGQNGQDDFNGFIGAGPVDGPFEWFDVLFGWQGGASPWGLRLSVGRAQDDPVGDSNNSDVTSVNVVFGTTMRNVDLSAEVSFATSEEQTSATDRNESSPVGFSVSARKTAIEESEDLQVGWLGMFSYVTGGTDVVTATTTAEIDDSGLAFVVGVGPCYTPTERTSVAMYGQFEYTNVSNTTGTTETTGTAYVIPGMNVAAEVEIASWLQWRGAVVSRYAIANEKAETPGSPTDESQTAELSFAWHTGLGFTFSNFKLDGYIDPSVVTSGTDLLGSDDSLFGMVSATYSF
ncbi:MAG TPA: hypothetical protein VFD07_10675 [Candidatus Krumholzibacteria bacterium]|nr:hypothetical protein [Candidatus Krumholzibacteria bacterium]